MEICQFGKISSKRMPVVIIGVFLVYAILPIRFAVKYDYIPNEEIKFHLAPSSVPDAESCPLIPKLTMNAGLTTKYEDFDQTTYAFRLKVQKGGFWKPDSCKYIHDIAVIVPYRGRTSQLNTFLRHIHPFLQKQLISYRIFVVEQTFLKPFNRGLLLNIGYLEALKIHPYPCFIFHDVDLLPLVEMNIYGCTHKPRHLSAAINTWRYKLKYLTAFGGVIAILQKHFSQVNGFSNKYTGWGGEDDDLIERILVNNLGYCRFSPEVSKYRMLHHKAEKKNPDRIKILSEAHKRFKKDEGLVMATKIVSVDFEVFGKVQGVFFRKCTQEQAVSLGLRGWCMNTKSGTVKGSIEGDPVKIEEMKDWLRYKGSFQSRIDKAVFSNEKELTEFCHDNFSIKR